MLISCLLQQIGETICCNLPLKLKCKGFQTRPFSFLNIVKTRACGIKFYCEQINAYFIFLIFRIGINNSTCLRDCKDRVTYLKHLALYLELKPSVMLCVCFSFSHFAGEEKRSIEEGAAF